MTQPLIPDTGTYALILRCRKTGNTTIGKLGKVALHPGFYIYVGSALGPGGIKARVSRHRRRRKKLHWHIDYLRRHTALVEAWTMAGAANREHDWAETLIGHFESAHDRFGASDCRCLSHLFYSADRPSPDCINAMLRDVTGQLEVVTFIR